METIDAHPIGLAKNFGFTIFFFFLNSTSLFQRKWHYFWKGRFFSLQKKSKAYKKKIFSSETKFNRKQTVWYFSPNGRANELLLPEVSFRLSELPPGFGCFKVEKSWPRGLSQEGRGAGSNCPSGALEDPAQGCPGKATPCPSDRENELLAHHAEQ